MADTLRAWLERAGLVEIYDGLAAEDVDLDVLLDLTADDMRALGLSIGNIKRLSRAIDRHRAAVTAMARKPGRQQDAPERRRLTVMFIDLVGSTELSAKLDVEDFRLVVATYQSTCAAIVGNHGGAIAKYMGDGVLAYFGYPQAAEHAAENAVRAGLAIIDAIDALEPLPEIRLRTRIGIATGMAIVGDLIGSGASYENQIVGDTPNLAARLQVAAKPNTMLISEATRELVGPLFDYHENTGVSIKGFDLAVTCYSVLAEREVDNRFRAGRGEELLAPLQGRSEELALLTGMWDAARAADNSVAIISAEGGMGKSRLLAALEEAVAAGPHFIVNCSCQPQFQNSTLKPVRTFLSRHARFERGDSPAERFAKVNALLERHGLGEQSPLFAVMLEIPPSGVYAPPEETPQRQRQTYFRAMVELIRAMGQNAPLLISIEDLQWADATTLEFLQTLPEALAGYPSLIVATTRPNTESALASGASVRHIELGGLSDSAVEALARQTAGERDLPASLIRHVQRLAEGNALFVEELTKALLESDAVREADGRIVFEAGASAEAVPATLHDSLMARLDRLDDAKEYAQIASVIGREFSLHLLVEVCGRPSGSVLYGMARLEEAEIVFPYTVEGERHWSFKHALIQEAAYESQLRSRRRALHGAIASAIERVLPEELTLHPEIMAHHLSRAGESGRAIEFGCVAGLGALMRSASAEAVAHTRDCLDWLAGLEPGISRDLAELGIIAIRTPAILQHQGYTAQEIEALEQRVLELLDRVGDRPETFPNLLGFKVFHHVRSERERARDLAERFLALADRLGDESSLAAGLPMIGQCSWIEAKLEEAEEQLRRGIALYDADAHGMHAAQYGFDTLSYCRMTLSQVLWMTGRDAEALREARAALDHARAINHTNTIGLALLYVIMLHQQRGEREEVARLAEEALAYCDRMGVSTPTSYIALIANWAAGNIDGSEELFAVHLALGAKLGLTYYRSLAVENCIEAGDAKRAAELLAPALEQARETGERYWLPRLLALEARVANMTGDGDPIASLEAAADEAREHGAWMLEAMALNDLCTLLPGDGSAKRRERLDWLIENFGIKRPEHPFGELDSAVHG